MKKTLFKIFDKFTEKVDTYHNNGSMWFIFTDEKKWVIELTNEGTLWYNFYFFKDCFKYLSLDVVENQHYITEWVKNTIQNGVRYTTQYGCDDTTFVESVIQNGVRSTVDRALVLDEYVENTIQNGVKHTEDSLKERMFFVEDTIQNGVKRTELGGKDRKIDEIKDIVENGIKETHEDAYHNKGRVEGVIRNGIKETKHGIHFFEDTTENVIKNGIKEVIELPDKSGELNGYGEYYARQKNMTYPHTDIVNDVITDGIKETNWRKVDNHPTYLDHILIEKD